MGLIRYAVAAQLVVLATSSQAADAPSRTAKGVAPSAFYVGVQGGMVWAQDKMQQYSIIIPLFQLDMKANAAFGGLHVGYQRLLDNVLVGLEADYDQGGKQGSGAGVYSGVTLPRTFQADYRSTLRARIGYDFGTLAVYATGGGAMTNLKTTAGASTVATVTSGTAFAFGATLGAGVVYKINRNWAAFSEYRYADFGQSTSTTDPGLPVGARAVHRVNESSIRAGASYYFR